MSDAKVETVKKMDTSNDQVIGFYKESADIAQAALKHAMGLCVPGARVFDVTSSTDAFIMAAVEPRYAKRKDFSKGIGFPTCCSLNGLVGHVSPLSDHKVVIADGDLVKLDLGVQMDGFLAVVAHTFVVQAEPAEVTGSKADVIVAAHKAAQLAARLLKDGATNTVVTEAIAAIAADYHVTPVLGVLSHNMEKGLIDGEKTILNKEDAEHKGKECTFAAGEVYALDIVMSTGEGKPCRSEERTSVYKRTAIDQSLKVAAARSLKAEAEKRFHGFPFSLNVCNPKTARLGVIECEKTGTLEPFPVLSEKKGFIVAQTKVTAMMMPNGTTQIITGLPVDEAVYKSEHSVSNEEFVALLRTNPAKKKAAAAAAAATEDKKEATA